MKTPAWLQAAGLILWGFAAGQGEVGALLAVARLLAPASGVRLSLGDRDLSRAVDLSMLVVLLTVVGFLVAQGLPMGLLGATGWLPAALFPLLLIDALSESRLRLRHLAATLRRSRHPDADRVADLGAPYLAVTLLAAGVLAKPSPWFSWALAAVMVTWLFQARPAPRAKGAAFFALAAIVAVAGGHGVGAGLQRAQGALQDWVVDAMSDTDPDPYQRQTRIGDLGRVKLSDRIVWRVEQTPPIVVPLLLRAGVFTRYADGAWVAKPEAFARLNPAPAAGRPTLRLHGQSRKGAAIVPVPIDAGYVGGEVGIAQRNAHGVVRVGEAPPLLDVMVASSPTAGAMSPEAADLALPAGFGDLMRRLPELAAMAHDSPHERLTGMKSWFAANFSYTLFLGDEQRGGRDIEHFLLTDRAGHCEYFATSTVLLLRALGIPARYVTGYSVQEYSRLEKAFLVRQRHAHAWAEAYVDGKWIEVDTTPATWLAVEENASPIWRPLADFMSFAWRRFVELRRDVAASGHPISAYVLGTLLVLLLAWLAFKRAGRARGGDKDIAGDTAKDVPGEEMRSFRVLELELAALGLGRRPSEPPRAWIDRVCREGRSVVGEPRIATACDLIEALYRNRYGCPAD